MASSRKDPMSSTDPKTLRIAALNLRQGGAPRAAAIAAALNALGPDVVVLSEAYPTGGRQRVLDFLAADGLVHQATADADNLRVASAVAIASRKPLADVHQPIIGTNRQRVLEARVDDVLITGVYFPLGKPKVAFWRDEFLPYAASRLQTGGALIGDWNSGSHYVDEAGATLFGAVEFEAMTTMGWTDAWRSLNPEGREFTWYSRPWWNGFRLDHAFLAPSLAARLRDARYQHGTRPHGAGIAVSVSDHSATIVDLTQQ